jgi:hypothetical protein
MKESDKLIAITAAIIAPFGGPAFNVMGTQTGRTYHYQVPGQDTSRTAKQIV